MDLKDGTLTFLFFQEITGNTFISYDMTSCNAPLWRLYERRNTSTGFNSIYRMYSFMRNFGHNWGLIGGEAESLKIGSG